MADKLNWLNKHLVVVRYITLKDVMEQEGYKIRPDLEELFTGMHSAEEMVYKFAGVERYKCAAELLAYIAHRRAGVWWGYRCVLSLLEELVINPAVDVDIADIGADFNVTVPDWAKVEIPKADPAEIAKIQADIKTAQAEVEKLWDKVDPEVKKIWDEAMDVANAKFKSIHGFTPMELMEKIGSRLGEDEHPIDPNSPIFTETAKIKAQLLAVQKETVDTIKSVIPPKVPEHDKKLRDNALTAVYRWVEAPDAENSQKCLNVGNECPDTPAGLLSLAAFWSYGDLLPLGKQPVPTPPGLAANGLCQVLLMCALHKGGTRKVKERYAEYFRLGVEVLTGADSWEASLEDQFMPHGKIAGGAASPVHTSPSATLGPETPPVVEQPPDPASNAAGGKAPSYKRWKPEGL